MGDKNFEFISRSGSSGRLLFLSDGTVISFNIGLFWFYNNGDEKSNSHIRRKQRFGIRNGENTLGG